jgi:hypothetical protein
LQIVKPLLFINMQLFVPSDFAIDFSGAARDVWPDDVWPSGCSCKRTCHHVHRSGLMMFVAML